MKSLLLLSLVILLSSSLFAQDYLQHAPSKPLTAKEKTLRAIREYAKSNRPVKEIKKTRGGTRLIAASARNYDGVSFILSDSTQYSYLSNYGYDPTESEFEFNLFLPEFYNTNTNFYDKAKRWSDAGSGLQLADSAVATFTTNHKLSRLKMEDVSASFASNTSYQYNLAELKTERIDSFYAFGSSFENKNNYAHNINKKVIEIKIYEKNLGVWALSEVDSLFYDLSGNMVQAIIYIDNSGVLEKNSKVIYTYTGAGNFLTEIFQDWDGTTWVNSDKTQNLYGAGPNPLSSTNSIWDAGAWVNDYKDSFQYASSPYPITNISYTWNDISNVWEQETKNNYTYNTNNQLRTALSQFWNGTTWEATDSTTYYYENYNPQSIEQTNPSVGSIKVYPIPATEVLNIKLNLVSPQGADVMIYNMNGQMILHKQLPKAESFNEQINISSLSNGHYILKLNTPLGELVSRFVKE